MVEEVGTELWSVQCSPHLIIMHGDSIEVGSVELDEGQDVEGQKVWTRGEGV